MDRKKPEILAPAGDLERLKIALHYGADAVYLGGTLFGLRANAINFTLEDLQEGVTFAHKLGKKIYVTVNIALHNKEIKFLKDYLQQLEKIGVDAIIVSDPAVIMIANECTELPIHLSTQQSTLNYEAIAFWKKKGVTRIVLGRETSREEIEQIRQQVDIEIECFIHGAMCASYSGRCVLSNFLTDRDSNRGGCSQICRWDFSLIENQQKLEGDKPFTFCTKDLSMLQYIPQLVELGVSSFKIEGRMRSVYYIATIVDVYRRNLDAYWNDPLHYTYNKQDEKILRRCANRDSVPQFFDGSYGAGCQYYNGRVEVSNQDFLGMVLDYQEDTQVVTIEQRNYFKVGDQVEFFGPNMEPFTMIISEIFDEQGRQIDVVNHPQQIVQIKCNRSLKRYDFMRIYKSEI